ncbi:MAG: glycosyltransferase family 2 protein [Candidatus Omnitrophica bacterium]|nr:glycosyltransferase family 2 protein [Candidatus Omnitrophota bacterium]
MPSISIITPFYNSADTIKEYLTSIFGSAYKDFELIIVDDGSERQCAQLFEGYPVVFKKLNQRKGAYYARNRGVEMAKGRLLLFLDADVIVRPDTLGRIAAVFDGHPEVSGLIGSYDDSPGPRNTVTQFKFLCHHFIHQQEGEYVGSFWTGCGAIKKDVFNELGGFNLDSLWNAIMDIDLGYRLRLSGHKIYNAKNIQVKHLKKLTFADWIYTDIFHRGLPWIKIMLQYKDFRPTLNVSTTGVANVVYVWLMLAISVLGAFNEKGLVFLPVLFGVFLISNHRLLSFFRAKRGFLFALKAFFLLLIYNFNCGLCVLLGLVLYRRECFIE